jgi:hypothetical protein
LRLREEPAACCPRKESATRFGKTARYREYLGSGMADKEIGANVESVSVKLGKSDQLCRAGLPR